VADNVGVSVNVVVGVSVSISSVVDGSSVICSLVGVAVSAEIILNGSKITNVPTRTITHNKINSNINHQNLAKKDLRFGGGGMGCFGFGACPVAGFWGGGAAEGAGID